MKAPQAPRLDERRRAQFAAELQDRARAWIPEWGLADAEGDFGRALLEIAARFSSEVAERLDGAGEKMRRGFLDWLAVRGQAARPARMPVVFKLADTATEGVRAVAPVRLQADAAGTPVVFETERDVRVIPGQLDVVVGVDADKDAFYLPPPGLNDLTPLKSLPTEWQLKSFAAAGAVTFQLEPEAGLLPGTLIDASGEQYRIVKADKDLVTIDRPLVSGLEGGSRVTKVTTFAPFDGRSYNQQQHALYFGDSELLNIETVATIDVVGTTSLGEGYTWQYWGKKGEEDNVGWQLLEFDSDRQKAVTDAVALKKSEGALEEREVQGKKARWIRAFRKTIAADAAPVTADRFALRVNASACGDHRTDCPPAAPGESPDAEGMANTTPLVLDNIFLPLGREPRQFDAFYLGSTEVLSKKGAQVRVCFELADPTFKALAAVRGAGPFGDKVLAGVGRDGALHLLGFEADPTKETISRLYNREPLRPPIPGDGGSVPTSTKLIGLNPECRPLITTINDDFFVDVASGAAIWTWHENASEETLSGWKEENLPLPKDGVAVDDIVPVEISGNVSRAVLTNTGVLLVRDGDEWSAASTVTTNTLNEEVDVNLVALVPIWADVKDFKPAKEMVGVSSDGLLYRVATDGECSELLLGGISVDVGSDGSGPDPKRRAILPFAYFAGSSLTVVAVQQDLEKLVAYSATSVVLEIELPDNDKIAGATVETSFVRGAPQFSVVGTKEGGATYIASWQPHSPRLKELLFRSPVSQLGSLGGAPVALSQHILVPGAKGDLFVARFAASGRYELLLGTPVDGVVLPEAEENFAAGDAISVIAATGRRRTRVIEQPGPIGRNSEVLYKVVEPFGEVAEDLELLAYRRSSPKYDGTVVDTKNLKLAEDDEDTAVGTRLLIDNGDRNVVRRVVSLSETTPPDAELHRAISATGSGNYWPPEEVRGRIAPVIDLSSEPTIDLSEYFLDQARFYFPTATPAIQHAKAFKVKRQEFVQIIALDLPWDDEPQSGDRYVIDATLGQWKQLLADTSSNPELSWEYSTSTSWEPLILEEEGTLNFKNTGAIRFTVPDDIAAVDWSGKTNHWIRARLIGGDYGKEEITVEIEVDSSNDKKSKQTVTRDTKGIRPPVVVRLHISYGFCKPVIPALVLAEDSGTIRDQSDANRTPGAIVEAFVPLALTLGRLDKDRAPIEATTVTPECPPECDCATLHTTEQTNRPDAAVTTPPESTGVTGRELYVGLTRTPSEAPVNVLLLVNEKDHSRFAPMSIEAFIADRFVPIVAEDKTRALGESGLLSMTFAIPPTPSELFGRTLSWLRLKPKKVSEGTWVPEVRGAYLNGAWASATETLTRELLGSSNGEPHLVVRVARPPVLHQTLQLRVREPLGEEEREGLLKKDAKSVLSQVEDLPGDWVLWKQVVDPDDEPASARVYSLDENTGEIRFGDGVHGKIPPIGRDAIVAFSYSRTEPDPAGGEKVPGNSIAPRTELNLVSPIETVETVTAADQAAGGAPPESDDRVLRFGFARLRHRERAITAEDIEDLALQSSPDIVQAHASVRRGYIRLVVVIRGKNPQPNAAQIRELRRLLLASAPVALSAPGALRIEPPVIRRLRVDLGLQVETLDNAGALTDFAKQNLAAFFDAATGGVDKDGWPLGINPGEADIALTLINAPYLESITDVQLREITREGQVLPSLEKVRANELVMLASDPVRIQFETSEVMV